MRIINIIMSAPKFQEGSCPSPSCSRAYMLRVHLQVPSGVVAFVNLKLSWLLKLNLSQILHNARACVRVSLKENDTSYTKCVGDVIVNVQTY